MFHRTSALIALAFFAINAQAARPLTQPVPLGDHYPVEVVLTQQEIGVDVPETNPMAAGGGLIGALITAGIDNSRTKSAEESIVPLRDLLISYDFNEAMEQAIRAKVPSPGISPDPVFNFQTSALDPTDAQKQPELAPQALELTPHYSFDNKFTEMTVKIIARVLQRSVKSNGKIKERVEFVRIYAYHIMLPDAGKTDPNLEAWVALGGPRLVELLNEGVQQSVDLLVFDFSEEGRTQWEIPEPGARTKWKGRKYRGTLVRETPEWVWTRYGRGLGMTLSGYQFADASNTTPTPAEAPATQQ